MSIYQLLSEYYDDLFPAREPTVAFLARQFADPGKVLDIGCGTGSHCIALAERGFQVTGIDPDPQMIKKAKDKGTGANPRFHTAGLGSLSSLHDGFNGIYCIGNTLVHLPDREAVRQSFYEVFDILLPEGLYILQIVNYDRILRESITSLPSLKGGEAALNRHYTLAEDGKKVLFEIELSIRGEGKEETEKDMVELLPLKKEYLEECAASAGFVSVEAYGNFEGESYTPDSGATILVLRKE